jgi:predicted dehydrogenase
MSEGNPVLAALGRPIRLGILGGAPPSLIGPVHRMAAALDGRFTLVAGMMSSKPERSRREGVAIGLAEERCYGSLDELLAREKARADGVEALAIITPNDSHTAYCKAAFAAGLDVMVEKPLCNDLGEARELAALARESGFAVALTHTYSGYPMLREMRARILAGEIGAVRLVQIDYLAGGNATLVEATPEGAARWRLNPEISGPSLVLGDIGTHAHHLVGFVTGEAMASVSAEVGTLVPGRKVHDIAQIRFRLEGGARGRIEVSNAAAGMSNVFTIRVFGESGHLAWSHGAPNELLLGRLNGDIVVTGAGRPDLSESARDATRLLRPGHPEGLIEAIANLYSGFADLILARRGLRPITDMAKLTPSIEDGVAGLAFVMACLESSAGGGASTPLASSL